MEKKILSEEHKRNISLALKGRTPNNIDQIKGWNKGLCHSEETKRKIGIIGLGRVCSKQTRHKLSLASKGKKLTETHKENIRLANIGLKHKKERVNKMIKSLTGKYIGNKASNWKGGITDLNRLIRGRTEYKQWVSACMSRDNWTCGTCNKIGGCLQVHHKESFSNLLKLYHIKTVDEALKCIPLWNLNNGVTLCKECHKLTETYLKNNQVNYEPLFTYFFNELKGGFKLGEIKNGRAK